MSSALPTINPALFVEPAAAPQELTLPVNFWALLFAPPSDAEFHATEQVDPAAATQSTSVTPIKVASPQQIAQALIRSMLTPVAPVAEPEHLPIGQHATEPSVAIPESEAVPMEKIPKKASKQQELTEPLAMPPVIATPGIPPPIVRAPQPDQTEITEKVPLQGAPPIHTDQPLPTELTSSKASSDAPVAFELRLTPALAEPAITAEMTNSKAPPEATVAFELHLTPAQADTARFGDESATKSADELQPMQPQSKEIPAPDHPRFQRSESSIFERKPSRENVAAQMPAPVKHDQVIAEFQTILPQHETVVPHSAKPSAPDAPAATPTPIEAPKIDAPATPVRDLSMRVSAPDSQSVDVRVTERGGEVHVAVRTADSGLQTSLQSDLGSLVGKLEQSGFRTEALIPEPARHLSENNIAAHPLSTQSTADLSGSGTYGESQDAPGESRNDRGGSDSRNSDRQQQQQHRRPIRAWEEMMEEMQ